MQRIVAQNRLPRRVKTTNLQEITTMPVTYTKKQRQAIIKWWSDSFSVFRFMKDGSVEAKKRPQSPWGILYSPQQALSHLRERGLGLPKVS